MPITSKGAKRKRRDPHAGRPRGSQLKTGHRGGPRTALTEVQKVILGGGQIDSMQEIEFATAWRGSGGFKHPFNAAQVEVNRKLYPWVFENGRRSR